MTAEFIIDDQELEAPQYPEVLGVSFTPQVIGILVAIAGLAGAGYVVWKMVLPAREAYAGLEANLDQVEAELQQNQISDVQSQIQALNNELAQKEALRPQISGLFGRSETLPTLLRDISTIMQSEGVTITGYDIEQPQPQIVEDDSLGTLVNKKVLKQTIGIEFQGNAPQTEAVFKKLERFETMLFFRDTNIEVEENPIYIFDPKTGGITMDGELILNTSFTMDVVAPLSQEELDRIAEEEAAAAAAEAEAAAQ